MIRRLVDFALQNRFLVLAAAILLFAWGVVSFHQLPVEAYPDVANNYVDVIAQWPGISAEQIEQQVTDPARNRDERCSGSRPCALLVDFRALDRGNGLRRGDDGFRESRTGSGAAFAGNSASGCRSADGDGLEPGRPDLFLHAAKYEPRIRRR